uniref:G-protein coupled receptors family 1 profile domain-containing protein n=1 Tax=Ciona savignyi TaxID=51511 RepID=H2YNT7_CIOSA
MFASAPLGNPCNLIASVFPIVVMGIPYMATVGLTLATLKITTKNLAAADSKRGKGRASTTRKASWISAKLAISQSNSETRQLMVTVTIMISFFSIMMLPFTLMMPLIYSTIMPCRQLNWLKLIASEFLMANSCVNFIVYNVRSKEFRESVKATLRNMVRYAVYRRDKRRSTQFRKSTLHRVSQVAPMSPQYSDDVIRATSLHLPRSSL